MQILLIPGNLIPLSTKPRWQMQWTWTKVARMAQVVRVTHGQLSCSLLCPAVSIQALLPTDRHSQMEMCRPHTDDYEGEKKKGRELFVFTCTETSCPKQVQTPDISWCNGHAPSSTSSASTPEAIHTLELFYTMSQEPWQHLDTSLSWQQGNVEIHQTKTKSVPKLGKIHMGTAWNIKTTSRSTQHRLHSGDYSSTKKTSSQLLSRRNAVNPATQVIYTPPEEHVNCTQSLC